MYGSRIERKNADVYNVFRQPRNETPFDFLPNAVSASGDLSAKADIGFHKEKIRNGSNRGECPEALHALCHSSLQILLK